MSTVKTLISLGAIMVSGTVIFLGTTEKGRNILKKNPKFCPWVEKKEKELEEKRKLLAERRAEREKQRRICEEQERERTRLRNLFNYHYNQYFAYLRWEWPLRIDPETCIQNISGFDESIKQSLCNYGIHHVSGLLYHYMKRSWHGDDRFTDISGIGIKRSALLVHYIQSNVRDWNKMSKYSTRKMDECNQTFYNYRDGVTASYCWL